MRFAVKSCHSLRTLLIVMIAAPILPTVGLGPLVLARLGPRWHELGAVAGIALIGIVLRVIGGIVALAAAGRLVAIDAGARPGGPSPRRGRGAIRNPLRRRRDRRRNSSDQRRGSIPSAALRSISAGGGGAA